jgi:hypothetical protein
LCSYWRLHPYLPWSLSLLQQVQHLTCAVPEIARTQTHTTHSLSLTQARARRPTPTPHTSRNYHIRCRTPYTSDARFLSPSSLALNAGFCSDHRARHATPRNNNMCQTVTELKASRGAALRVTRTCAERPTSDIASPHRGHETYDHAHSLAEARVAGVARVVLLARSQSHTHTHTHTHTHAHTHTHTQHRSTCCATAFSSQNQAHPSALRRLGWPMLGAMLCSLRHR